MEEKKGFPLGFYVCSLTFSFERAAYYASKFLIFYFIFTAVAEGGLGLDKSEAAKVQANLVAFTYLAPIIGGYICDRFLPARIAIPLGMFLMAGGYYAGSTADSMVGVNIMLWLVVVGTGLFKGNLSALSGRLFSDKEKLDSAFSTQYSFVNIGAFLGTTLVGIFYLQTFYDPITGVLGFSQSFLIAAIACAVGGMLFILASPLFGEHGKKPFGADTKKEETKTTYEPLTATEKKRVLAICLVSAFSVVFWVFWYLSYLAAYDYGETYVNMFVGNYEVPLAWFDSLNALGCIALGPVFALLWLKLSKREKGDMSLFKKTGFGLWFLGSSFLMLVLGDLTRGDGQASIIWLILFGILLTVGEMFFSPLGNSFVSKYAPGKYLAILMGVWTFATFLAGKSYGVLYAYFNDNFTIVEYSIIVFIITFIVGVLVFIADKPLSKLIAED